MFTGAIQVLAVFLFAICFYYCGQAEGRRYAQQWFAVGYLFALIRENLLVLFGAIRYSDQMTTFGNAPVLTAMWVPALLYVGYTLAQRFVAHSDLGREELRPIAYTMFLLTPALALPLDATALHFGWWSFPSESRAFLNGIPYYVPFTWGLTAALFYAFIWRIRQIRFRGSGQLFALVTGSPLVAGINILLVALLQVLAGVLGLGGQDVLLNLALGLLFVLLPMGLILNFPRFVNTRS